MRMVRAVWFHGSLRSSSSSGVLLVSWCSDWTGVLYVPGFEWRLCAQCSGRSGLSCVSLFVRLRSSCRSFCCVDSNAFMRSVSSFSLARKWVSMVVLRSSRIFTICSTAEVVSQVRRSLSVEPSLLPVSRSMMSWIMVSKLCWLFWRNVVSPCCCCAMVASSFLIVVCRFRMCSSRRVTSC